MQKFVRKLARSSTHSYAINVPKQIVSKLKLRERQKLEIIFDEEKKQFIVKDWKK